MTEAAEADPALEFLPVTPDRWRDLALAAGFEQTGRAGKRRHVMRRWLAS